MSGQLTGERLLSHGVSRETARQLFAWMVRSRAVEDRLHVLFRQGRLRGRLISGRGQEAIPVGMALAAAPCDVLCPVHRDLGVHLVRGTTAEDLLLHYFGRAAGLSHGRDGDIHVGDWSRGVFPMVSHLPDSWPVAVGIGLAARLRGESRAVVAFCGDGATSTGAWHESLNFASVFQTPNVFVVENNQYAYSTPARRQYRVRRLVDRAAAYGMPGVRVDGNDALAVYAVATQALDRARAGGGPTLVEAVTMRMDGHAAHDEARYVPPALRRQWQGRDPIERLGAELSAHGVSAEELQEVRATAQAAVEAAVRAAEAAPFPDPRSLDDGVFAPDGGI